VEDWLILGLVPDVDGVGDECGELEEDELLELGFEGGCCTWGGCCCCCWTLTGSCACTAGVTVVRPSG